MDKAIEKLIDRLGILLEIKRISKIYYVNDGPSVCISITAYYKNKKEYEQHHCYTFNMSKKDVSYEQGNKISEGIFRSLGIGPEVDKYFERKAREFAKDFFMEQYF